MSNTRPSFQPTSKRRSFRPSTYKSLNPPTSLDSLNESLRASLMSVGMRVRKSVPEGYKTTTKPKFSIYEQTAAAYPELQPFASIANSKHVTDYENDENSTDSGDMMTDEQLEDAVDSVLDGLDADLTGWDNFGSSQESNSSTSTVGSVRLPVGMKNNSSVRRKRSLGDDEEDFGFGIGAMDRDTPLRQIAQPRSRKPALRRVGSDKSSKNVRFADLAPAPDDDFGEAEFLIPDQNWD